MAESKESSSATSTPTTSAQDIIQFTKDVLALRHAGDHFSNSFSAYFQKPQNKDFVCNLIRKAVAEQIKSDGSFAKSTANPQLKLGVEIEAKILAERTEGLRKPGPRVTIALDGICEEPQFAWLVESLCRNIPLADTCAYEYNVFNTLVDINNFNAEYYIHIVKNERLKLGTNKWRLSPVPEPVLDTTFQWRDASDTSDG